MTNNIIQPRQALNKAFLKVRPNRNDIEKFKSNLNKLLQQINSKESEEFHKNLISEFLKNTYYSLDYSINTKGRNDLVIHNGKDANTTVGVILEAKKPTNKSDMVTRDNLNTKAFQELVLYFLRERIIENNLEIRYLIATNINEWFIFDAQEFEKYFIELTKQFTDFKEGRLSGKNTDFFYKHIASPAIDKIKDEIKFTYFNIQDYQTYLTDTSEPDDRELIVLFKLLSPEHLLKLPFANDSNSLDKTFYSELLHIIGLTETKEGNKKVIERKKETDRNTGSLIENAISQLDNLDKINRLSNSTQFGNNTQERLFNVALELVITWINRILFLKLLESQLLKYHKSDKSFTFLSLEKVKTYNDLNSLFFSVLARKQDERSGSIKQLFPNVPYLNSSLFELTDIEQQTIVISNLDNENLSIFTSSVLKDSNGKRQTGTLNALEYLFEFLNAYDFSSEGSEDIQEENKTLINAAVLGLIFEKINGYKDGSFFTPGYITMYMCRETIRRAVVQKFNQENSWNCENIEQLYDKITDKKAANKIINELKICDPAVGSGHFLVSALNEIIAIKSDLKILLDKTGKTLRDYHVEVVNDELIITDDDGRLFEYNPKNQESQRIQEALFHEKQTIIENCLYGVDINPNSVKICRLRLWIELLKNAYYTAESNYSELETLPNIDINIKCGNSLISRFSLDADLKNALTKSKSNISSYRHAIQTYRNPDNKKQKRDMEKLINEIKNNFSTEIGNNDPKVKKLEKLKGELYNLLNQTVLFEENEAQKQAKKQKEKKLNKEIEQLTTEIEQIKNNKIYENAFEWRFEFPEVLNDSGDFVGFDMIIGNPPYVRQEQIKELKPALQAEYECYTGVADIYVYFYERGLKLLKDRGNLTYISSNKYFRSGYGQKLRKYLAEKTTIQHLLDFGDSPVFDEAIAYPSIILMTKEEPEDHQVSVMNWNYKDCIDDFIPLVKSNSFGLLQKELTPNGWRLESTTNLRLLDKLRSAGTPLGDYVEGKIYYGIKSGLNEAFVIDQATRDKLIAEDAASQEIIKPLLRGRDVKRWRVDYQDLYLIITKRGIEINKYPAIEKHLFQYKDQLTPNGKSGRAIATYKWYELQVSPKNTDWFEKPKIIIPDIAKEAKFTFDLTTSYVDTTCFFIPVNDLYLLGILNSKVILYFYTTITSQIRGGYLRYKKQYIEQIPIPNPTKTEQNEITLLVQRCLDAKGVGVEEWEAGINELVADLYGLTEEEKRIIAPDKPDYDKASADVLKQELLYQSVKIV